MYLRLLFLQCYLYNISYCYYSIRLLKLRDAKPTVVVTDDEDDVVDDNDDDDDDDQWCFLTPRHRLRLPLLLLLLLSVTVCAQVLHLTVLRGKRGRCPTGSCAATAITGSNAVFFALFFFLFLQICTSIFSFSCNFLL